MAAFHASTTTLFSFPPNPSPKPSFLPPPAASATHTGIGTGDGDGTPSSTLSDQLHHISLRLLSDNPSSTSPAPPLSQPKPTWVNPSKPRPSVLSLSRHRRQPLSRHPNPSHLSPLLRQLRSLADADDPTPALAAFFSAAPPSQHDVLFLLKYLQRTYSKSLQTLAFLQSVAPDAVDTLCYNLVFKSLKDCTEWLPFEQLANDMVAAGVAMDNITYSMLITSAKRRQRYGEAISWFERMYKSGVLPDEVTYSAVIDVYARLGRREEVMRLFDRARAVGWEPDVVAFAMLARMFGYAGDFEGVQFVLREMRAIGIRANLMLYNTLLEAMGKTGKPGTARDVFNEMLAAGVEPDCRTFTALINVYGKARWGRDALALWARMRANNMPVDFILYNTLLSMCADLGLEAEAEELFNDLKRTHDTAAAATSGAATGPDAWTYSAMMDIYGSFGKADRALALLDEMLERGVEPNIMTYTCLIKCLGDVGRMEDAARIFNTALERSAKLDDRFCGCLLSLIAIAGEPKMDMMLNCLEKVNPRMFNLIGMLRDENNSVDDLKEEFRAVMNAATKEVRRPFCNCLIDICRNHRFPHQRAGEVFRFGSHYGLYDRLAMKKADNWSLNLRSLSVGAAEAAFDEWARSLAESMEMGENLPELFWVWAGAGTHRLSKGLAGAIAAHLGKVASPFQESVEKNGGFVASREEMVAWLRLLQQPTGLSAPAADVHAVYAHPSC